MSLSPTDVVDMLGRPETRTLLKINVYDRLASAGKCLPIFCLEEPFIKSRMALLVLAGEKASLQHISINPEGQFRIFISNSQYRKRKL
jgi:hypothetical protein